ncbi:MAG TPA: DUF2007 domain-containing protein [Amphiplicatus sp.]|nr:hypothetical protein [Amphiplicatus sp.]MCB9954786.1 hypothetical protein [Caulobacterales bacterium]HOP19274.1 DUF2007 domain-containing protein [Amphiplicatus sp.]HRX40185.1 DUF2007 domain-containing protein [Parvularculaceae bacterium]
MTDLQRVASFYDPEEAHVACGFLNANGIDATVFDADTLTALPSYRVALGGIRIVAPAEQVEDARNLLEMIQGGEAKRKGYKIEGVRCPACGNTEFTRVKPWFFPFLIYFSTGVPIWWNSKRLRCTNCGAITDQQAEQAE